MSSSKKKSSQVTALKVEQWLKKWDGVKFNDKTHRSKPPKHFYMFSLSASQLRSLSGIHRRSLESGKSRSEDLGVQRRHDPERSSEIRQFVEYGFPWSDLSEAKRNSGDFDNLRMPGWLPTAILVNILKPGDLRKGKKVDSKDLINVSDSDSHSKITFPDANSSWKPKDVPPIEVIDGQHRLWAFEGKDFDGNFELPVIAFHGLDISWQAYLFWTINIKPKRINASFAFDLYPLLRTEDWLEKFEGHSIYRETRAQELTETLWSHTDSPWHNSINMLGESKVRGVSQAAWIRSLLATFIKAWDGKKSKLGGLFGAPLGDAASQDALPWTRAQQAAFLIFAWEKFHDAVSRSKEKWIKEVETAQEQQQLFGEKKIPAFYGNHTLINTDQGVRGFLYIINDLCYVNAQNLSLQDWESSDKIKPNDEEAVSKLIDSLKKKEVNKFLDDIAKSLSSYDWRSSSAPGLSEGERRNKMVFKGSSGYKELRMDLLKHIAKSNGAAAKVAKQVLELVKGT